MIILPGARAAEIDRAGGSCASPRASGSTTTTSCLATGARNRVPPLPGIELDGVCYLRNLAETDELRERLAAAEHIVVIGAGFIGLEFAAVARGKGKPVHIVELTDRVMGRVVCPPTSDFFAAAHRKQRGRVQFWRAGGAHRGAGRQGRPCRAGRRQDSSRPISCWSASASCRTASWPPTAGLAVQNGIVVDAQLLTADPAISAIGDCCAFPSRACAAAP